MKRARLARFGFEALRAGLAAAVASWALAAGAPSARADTPPSTWDVARDPAARDRWALHVRVVRLLHPPETDDAMGPELRRDDELRLEAARALLEDANADRSPDVRLRFDLGIVYERLATVEKRNDLEQKVVDVLAPALEQAPDHPASTEAFESLVYAYAKLDRPHEELATWRRYIPRVTDDDARVAPLMNMGEAEMRLGLLEDALATFREGLRICETLPSSSGVNATYALTLWDVALALDRSGDPAASLSTAAKARSWTWMAAVRLGPTQAMQTLTGWDVIRDEGSVFFVPEWERQWYLALGFASAASAAADPRDGARMWRKAEEHWDAYVTRSSAAPDQHDRWLPIARARLAHARAARADAEKRASKLPPRAPPSGGEPWLDD